MPPSESAETRDPAKRNTEPVGRTRGAGLPAMPKFGSTVTPCVKAPAGVDFSWHGHHALARDSYNVVP